MTASGSYQPGPATPVGPKGPQAPVGYLSIEGAAGYASVSTRTIKRWITQGLPVYQGMPRGKVLIRPSEIDGYLQKKTAPQLDLDVMVEQVMQDLSAKPKRLTIAA